MRAPMAGAAAIATTFALALAPASTTAAGTTLGSRSIPLGTVITSGANGHTAYLFQRDGRDHSSCNATCAATWKPVLVAPGVHLTGGAGVSGKLIGSIARGSMRQVTYNHHPLYVFSGDTKAGTAKGENQQAFGGRWFAVSVTGSATKPGGGLPSFY